MSMDQRRIDGFDVLRVFSMTGVVFMHAVGNSLRTEQMDGVWLCFIVLISLAFTAVSCFFMISGALILGRKGEIDFSDFYLRHLPRIILPLVVWSMVSLTTEQEFTSIKDILRGVLSVFKGPAIYSLWFLYTLIPLYILAPFLKLVTDHLTLSGKYWLIAIIVSVNIWQTVRNVAPVRISGWMDIDLPRQLFLFEGYLGFFLLGALLRELTSGPPRWIKLAPLILAFISLATWIRSRRGGNYIDVFQSQNRFFTGALSVCLFLFFLHKKAPQPVQAFARWLSQLSFGVYLTHGYMLRKVVSRIPLEGWSKSTVLFMLTLVLCTLLIFVLASIRPLCFICTGIPWETACRSCNIQWLVSELREKHEKRIS